MPEHAGGAGGLSPRILVFSTNNISDPGIDLAGSRHLHYPSTVFTVNVPCSSSIKPTWIVHALKNGFDGVFIAADGDECAYLPDCNSRTARIAAAMRGPKSAAVRTATTPGTAGAPLGTVSPGASTGVIDAPSVTTTTPNRPAWRTASTAASAESPTCTISRSRCRSQSVRQSVRRRRFRRRR